MSRIEQIIAELEGYIATCKKVPLSSTNIYVNREEIEDLIHEMRLKTPDEIKKYQKLISNKDAILADAKNQADQMIREAQLHAKELVDEHEIMQRAYEQANEVLADASRQAQEIIDRATKERDHINFSAIRYTDELLTKVQYVITHSLEDSRAKYEGLIASLEKDLSLVVENRQTLRANNEGEDQMEEVEEVSDDGPEE